MADVNYAVNPALGATAAGWPGDSSLASGGARVAAPAPAPPRPDAYQITLPVSDAYVETPRNPITPGQTYTISAYLTVSENREYFSDIVWRDASGAFLDWGPAWETSSVLAGAWYRVSLTNVAPAGSAYVSLRFTRGAANSTQLYITCVQLESGGSATSYVDGESAGYQWTGARHDSTSILASPSAPSVSSLVSDFTELPAFFTGNFGGVSIVDGQGQAPTINSYSAWSTGADLYRLTDSALFVKVPQVSGTAGSRQNSIKFEIDANNSVEMSMDGGTFKGRVQKAGTTTDTALGAYSATADAWWRVRESGGTVYWDTSPDAVTWNNRGSAIHGLDLTAVKVNLQAGYWNAAEAGGPFPPAIYDNLNTVPPPSGLLWAGDYAAVRTPAGYGFTNVQYQADGQSIVNNYTGSAISGVSHPLLGSSLYLTLNPDEGRIEATPPSGVSYFGEGADAYFRFDFVLDSNFEINATNRHHAISQIHSASGTASPPLEFDVVDGGLYTRGASDAPEYNLLYRRLCDVVTGVKYSVIFRVVFSFTPGQSLVEVWVDGTQRLSEVPPHAMCNGGGQSYWKGATIYRSSSFTTTEGCWQSNHAIATTYGDLANLANGNNAAYPQAPAGVPVTSGGQAAGAFFHAG